MNRGGGRKGGVSDRGLGDLVSQRVRFPPTCTALRSIESPSGGVRMDDRGAVTSG